jgi:hypothetical protein
MANVEANPESADADGPKAIHLSAAGTIFYDNLERSYPKYPKIQDISLTPQESVRNKTDQVLLIVLHLFYLLPSTIFVEFVVGFATIHGYSSLFDKSERLRSTLLPTVPIDGSAAPGGGG